MTNDDTVTGEHAGQGLAEAYMASGKTGPVYAIVGRFDEGANAKLRMDGVTAALQAGVPQAQIFAFDSKADAPTSEAATASLLTKIPAGATILLIGVNDTVTYAEFQAAKNAGRQADVMVVSIGVGNPGGLQEMCQNKQYVGGGAMFAYTWPMYMIPALMARIQGATNVPDKIIVPDKFITPSQITQYYPDFKCATS